MSATRPNAQALHPDSVKVEQLQNPSADAPAVLTHSKILSLPHPLEVSKLPSLADGVFLSLLEISENKKHRHDGIGVFLLAENIS